jgi:tetratricopeptide (TPR) repeat protein
VFFMYSGLENWEESFQEVITLHKVGIKGDTESVEKAYQLIKKIKLQVRDNALVDAYYGSITALIARDHPNLIEKSKLAKKGLRSLDQSVQKDPNLIDIRILRGYVCYRLPEMFFKRTQTAIEDFTFLIDHYEQNKSKEISREFYFQLLFDLGMAYRNIGNETKAVSTWDKLEKLSTDSKYLNLVKEAKGEGK